MNPSSSCILGVPVHQLTMSSALDQLDALIASGRQDQQARYVATVNVDFLVNALGWKPGSVRSPRLLEALRSADLVTADGMPLVWYSRMMGHALPERVTGVDLVHGLAERASRCDYRVFLLGGAEGVADEAAERLIQAYPGLQIAGCASPMIQLDDPSGDDELLEQIHGANTDILLIAFGNPKQEFWFQRVRDRLKVPVSLGIGGTFDFITGRTKRAPEWMQNCGLEWVWRLSQEPKRLARRYGYGLVKFAIMALPPLFAHWTSPRVAKRQAPQFPCPKANSHAVLDFTQIQPIDLPTAGDLVRWLTQQKQLGKAIAVTGLSPSQERWLTLHRIHDLIQEDTT